MDKDTMRARRENLALTQTELAERWQVTQNTISRWESGAVKMQHPAILDMALRWLEHERTCTMHDNEREET